MTQTPYVPGQSTETEAGPELAQSLIYDVTQEQIAGTAESISKIRPAYADLIEFYSRVFAAQAATRTGLNPAPIIIDPQTLQLKLDNQMPLISPEEFRIDTEACGKLLDEICRLAVAHAPKLAQAGETLAGCLEKDELDLGALFRDLLDAGDISKRPKPAASPWRHWPSLVFQPWPPLFKPVPPNWPSTSRMRPKPRHTGARSAATSRISPFWTMPANAGPAAVSAIISGRHAEWDAFSVIPPPPKTSSTSSPKRSRSSGSTAATAASVT